MVDSQPTQTGHLLLYKADAGSMSPEVVSKLEERFPGFRFVQIKKGLQVKKLVEPRGIVVMAGGDGSVERVARQLAGSKKRLGILPLGTYNNFAAGLGLPADLDRAIAVIQKGQAKRVTVGRANGRVFLEIAAIGLFGDAIGLGDELKDLAFGEMTKRLGDVAGAEQFEFTLDGDIRGRGRAMSLVITNTPSTGNKMPLGTSKPTDAELELALRVGSSRTDVVGRVLASALLDKHSDPGGLTLRFRKLRVATKPRVTLYVDDERVGRTPVEIRAEPGALRVFMP